ncbi:MAG TPA: RES family NAD+ phosphorylase [Hydrogenophaga sp.]|uniref:RES family NAD+ phosphorylase n=1 Tax=Hydrogenophaga sp. TaxID=1904254 RepID=UPI002D043E0D|nr:RES family NAD+ phosphorylase [Hydrogenophaga sp.]HSX92518.1 RES family NAD+ phosphorylase [Hydrogenophaga sp.]
MSAWSHQWFEAEGSTAVRSVLAWRGVEAQHVVSTMRLVDHPEEQALLEQLLEGSKPSLPPAGQGLHYLLATPFRYAPAHASRFRAAHAKGQWYGAESLFAACAEVAYWRRRFVVDSEGLRERELLTEHSFFQGLLEGLSIDLSALPWRQAREAWTKDSDYAATHALAEAAQAMGVQWLRYESVRAPGQLCAVALVPQCLSEPPGGLDGTLQTWHCKATRHRVMLMRGAQRWAWDF